MRFKKKVIQSKPARATASLMTTLGMSAETVEAVKATMSSSGEDFISFLDENHTAETAPSTSGAASSSAPPGSGHARSGRTEGEQPCDWRQAMRPSYPEVLNHETHYGRADGQWELVGIKRPRAAATARP